MKKLSKFEKMGIVAAIIIACTFFYVKKVYEPQEARLKKTVQSLNKVVEEINSLKDTPPPASVAKSLKKSKKALDYLNKRLDGMMVRTGADREITNLLSDINRMIAANGLRVNKLTPKGRVTDELLEWTRFDIDLAGSFDDFLLFLKDLRELKDAVKVEEVNIEKNSEERLHIKLKLMI